MAEYAATILVVADRLVIIKRIIQQAADSQLGLWVVNVDVVRQVAAV